MPYIKRNESGDVIALSKGKCTGFNDFLEDDSPEVLGFLDNPVASDVQKALKQSDRELARVAEDLIQLLIQKNIIIFTELPDAVQQKILKREQLRNEMNQRGTFLDEQGSI